MSGAVPGDPSGCSQLGAELRSRAAGLLDLHAGLAGHPAPARTLALLDVVAVRLDTAGAVLQRYAQDLAGLTEEARRLEQDVRAAGLELDGLRVVEPWGVATPQAARARLAAQPALQARAERLASRLARARGALRRALDEARTALDRAAGGAAGGAVTGAGRPRPDPADSVAP